MQRLQAPASDAVLIEKRMLQEVAAIAASRPPAASFQEPQPPAATPPPGDGWLQARIAALRHFFRGGRQQLRSEVHALSRRAEDAEHRLGILEMQLSGQRLPELERTVSRLQADLQFEHRRLASLTSDRPDAMAPSGAELAAERAATFLPGVEPHESGSAEEILHRYRHHLDRIRAERVVTVAFPLLDIGCRHNGEWLELLRESGIGAYGVAPDARTVDDCRRRGLAVHRETALHHLAGLPDASLGAISAFGVIERLPIEQLLQLLAEACRALVADGLLLLETPNPENLTVGACSFHADPTRHRPVPADLARYLLERHGFNRLEILRINPSPQSKRLREDSDTARLLNELVHGPRDLAVIARRA